MSYGKIRSRNHILGEQAINFLQRYIIPDEWVIRQMNPDYGIDLDVELFDYECGQCVTLGEHLFMQVKGTETPIYGKLRSGDRKIDVIKYKLEVSELELVKKMGSAFPVLLIVVDLSKNCAYQICLNDYIKLVLPKQNPNYKNQKSVVIYIPLENEVLATNIEAFRWYSKRIKLYSMFHEMLVDIEDFKYMDNKELVESGKKFVEYYRQYNTLKNCSVFLLRELFDKIDYLYNNNYISKAASNHMQYVLGNKANWENEWVSIDLFGEEKINACMYAQMYSINELGNYIIHCSGMFETYWRKWYMPSLLIESNNG